MFSKQSFSLLALLAMLVLLVSACQDQRGHAEHDSDHAQGLAAHQPKTAEDSLYRQVMDIHDEVMPKMGKVRGAQQRAQQRLDSLAGQPSSNTKAYRRQLEQLINDLNYADFAMDKWMVEFNIDSAKDNKALRMQYLKDELEKVNKVKAAILGGLAGADSLMRQ
jgi:hypothetical protein